jgi:hypothetical protein
VASATGFAAGNYVLIDQEVMIVQSSYVSGTTIPVGRGKEGTQTAAHVITANVNTYLGSDSTGSAAQTLVTYPYVRARQIVSITATTATLTLPLPGEDMVVILNGTNAITLTVPVPTKDMDGCCLTILSNGVAAHVPTFTGGLGGVGAGYTAITGAVGARLSFSVWACNGAWNAISAPAWTGTVTKVIGGLA